MVLSSPLTVLVAGGYDAASIGHRHYDLSLLQPVPRSREEFASSQALPPAKND